MIISCRYTETNFHFFCDDITSIVCWRVSRSFCNSNLNSPWCEEDSNFLRSASAISTSQLPPFAWTVENISASQNDSMNSTLMEWALHPVQRRPLASHNLRKSVARCHFRRQLYRSGVLCLSGFNTLHLNTLLISPFLESRAFGPALYGTQSTGGILWYGNSMRWFSTLMWSRWPTYLHSNLHSNPKHLSPCA